MENVFKDAKTLELFIRMNYLNLRLKEFTEGHSVNTLSDFKTLHEILI